MAEVVIPFDDVAVKVYSNERSAPGQQSLFDASGRRYIVDTGVRVRRGTVRIDARTDGDASAHEQVFQSFHDSLNGDDNQADLTPYAGRYVGGAGQAILPTGTSFTFTSIADIVGGGSRVTLAFTGANNRANRAEVAKVIVVGAPIVVGGQRAVILAVEQPLSAGVSTVVFTTRERLTAGAPVEETRLAFEWDTYEGAGGNSIGAMENAGGRLVVPAIPPGQGQIAGALYFVNVDTGQPDLGSPAGRIAWSGQQPFRTMAEVGGIAFLPDGRYVVFERINYPEFVIVSAQGTLETVLRPSGVTGRNAVLRMATGPSAPVRDAVVGASAIGGNVYVIGVTGALSRIQIANLTNVQQGTFSSTIATGSQYYVQTQAFQSLSNTRQCAGMWTGPTGLRVLRQLTSPRQWVVTDLDIGSLPAVTGTDRYVLTNNRPFTGSAEVGDVLYAYANNGIYKYTQRSASVEAGADASSLRVNLLASGVELSMRAGGVMSATYAWEEIV